ncbi:MAG: potassium channel family protein [Actinomycetes bacterium]
MTNVFYLVLRRLRLPLITIVLVYTLCTVGLALTPGVDAEGNPTPGIGLFHAFYVISYTGTTIGFGEIPTAYSPAQRLWMTLSIYLTVVGWSYTIVTVFALLQDAGFQTAVRTGRFANRIRTLREPFYIVAGCGDTGMLVCRGLDRLGLRFVVLEADPSRVDELRLEEFRFDPPISAGDASQPTTLTAAGLLSPFCRGVMALTVDDTTNLSVAVNVSLLRPGLPVLARIRDPDLDVTHGVFGGDVVVNPFERFAEHLVSAIIAPERYLAREILTGLPGRPLPEEHHPPSGHWVMCGYGRFGHAITSRLREAGLTVSVVDYSHFGIEDVDVKGRGTEPGVLVAAGVEHAVGIVAGHNDDRRNLAIAVHARELNPDIFVVTRHNQASSTPLFEAFEGDLSMEPSRLVAQEFLAVITTPLMARYLEYLRSVSEPGCRSLVERLSELRPGCVPETWSVVVSTTQAPAVTQQLADDLPVRLGDLTRDPRNRNAELWLIPLVFARGSQVVVHPPSDIALQEGDEVLFAGSAMARRRQELTLVNERALSWVRTGQDASSGLVWRLLARRGRR